MNKSRILWLVKANISTPTIRVIRKLVTRSGDGFYYELSKQSNTENGDETM
jgi:hypothetical protein